MLRKERYDYLDKMVANNGLSQDGANFIRKSLDPFHDFEVPLSGYPDADTSKVVIQEVTKTIVRSKPSSISGNWDCHIASLPELLWSDTSGADLFVTSLSDTGINSNVGLAQPAVLQIGPVVISAVPSGASTFPDTAAPVDPLQEITAFNFNEYFDGQKRLIGMAFEVHNTTSELHRQGSVVTYRMPNVADVMQGVYTVDAMSPYETDCLEYDSRLPPNSLSKAMLYAGARQWKAADGCYSVSVFDADRNKLTGSIHSSRTFTQGDLPTIAGSFRAAITKFRIDPTVKSFKPTAFHTNGAYFFGLSAETTLAITVKLIFESCPTQENAQLVVLAQPSPDYDPIAIEIYKKVSAKLPSAVPVGMNASGDFWDTVLNIIGKAAPILASVIPGIGALAAPFGAMAGTVISGFQAKRNARHAEEKKLENKLVKLTLQDRKQDRVSAAVMPQIREQKVSNYGGGYGGNKNSISANRKNIQALRGRSRTRRVSTTV